ncbi:MAG: thioredoxin domain-containing protein [Candidatus Didemnitutus sp.]|nr:thioredoxin domain-containing protein [Candidatus Didemnitutus sp.]
MKSMRSCSLFLVLLAAAFAGESPSPSPLPWRAWSPEVFAEARRTNKPVLLDLEAVWCHWCHVMDATTYRDPAVVELLRERFLLVRVDQESRPDLANRYEDYGWPATVIFAPDGAERVKKQGYIAPRAMEELLRDVLADPTPPKARPSAVAAEPAGAPTLEAARRAELVQQWRDGYDERAGGWGFSHKLLDWDTVEFALRAARQGDAEAGRRARATLDLQRQLLDPVWGGVYQYSVGGDWHEPHFEKLVQMQAENLRLYALAYARDGEPADRAMGEAILRYLRTFLRGPEGAFYVSQDADLVPGEHSADYFALDDAARRARGVPRVDRHLYARENGWVIAALAQWSAVTGDATARTDAERAARWLVEHRALPAGGFRHDERDSAGPYLGDTLAAGRAFLALHQLTQEPEWLAHAEAAAMFIARNFARPGAPGLVSSAGDGAGPIAPQPQFDENVGVARFGAALARATGRRDYLDLAECALRWLNAPEVTRERFFYVGGLLLAEEEVRTEPAHVTIVGRRDDPVARGLFALALRMPETHKLVEWWDPAAGPAPRGEEIFPALDRAAAFLCAGGACSSPLETPDALQRRLAKLGLAPK